MISKNNSKKRALDKALNLLNSKYKRNYNQKIHDEFKDYLADNLYIIQKDMKLIISIGIQQAV